MSQALMDKAAIEAVLPHRDPMLLIDEVLELVPGERVLARKTITEEDCAGHFPGNPIMPGVKMVEALAQCGAVAVLSQDENRGKLALFAGIDDVRFKRIVRPGEVLDLECVVETVRGPVGRGKVKATVDGKLAVRGTLTFLPAAPGSSTRSRRPTGCSSRALPSVRSSWGRTFSRRSSTGRTARHSSSSATVRARS